MTIPSNLPTPGNYPASPAPIAEIFGFNKPKTSAHGADAHAPAAQPAAADHDVHAVPEPAAAPAPAAQFPIKGIHSNDAVLEQPTAQAPTASAASSHGDTPPPPTEVKVALWRNIVSGVLPYVAIFGIGLFVYFYFFNKIDFSSLFKSSPKLAPVVSQKDTQMQALESQNKAAYDKWIAGFYYDVSDAGVLDPNADNSGNGLTNFQKFLLNLNPKAYSTLGLDQSDTELLAQGTNPLSGNPLTDSQKQILNKYIDLEVAMNKLTVARMQKQGQVAGTSTNPNLNNSLFPRGPLNFNTARAASVTGSAEVNPFEVDIDQGVPGLLEIPSMNISAPLIWTKDPNNFEEDLKNGVVHYPGTALPGEIGTSYISGHSSNYAWVKSDYNHIFTHLDEVADFASFQITVKQTNGKNAILHYVVKSRQEFSPTDQAQFQNGGTSVVALSTCWPVGSTAKRYVIFGELTQVDK